ncbi:MAG: prolipoprotein diacylglyceryl transferase [Taibaiella sp.]|nr:prolipoprotein diacylglyceryl transferase [Taibaiella sp.]
MKQFFDIGSHFHLPLYNFFIGLGLALGMMQLVHNKQFKNLNVKEQHKIHLAVLFAVITGFIGAYLFDSLTQHQPLFQSYHFGLTLLGGAVTGFVILLIYFKVNHLPVIPSLNLLTPAFAIAHCFGRIGCFFAGCCFGKPTTLLFGVRYPVDSLPYQYYHQVIPLHPTQLYEALFALSMFLYLQPKRVKNAFILYSCSYGAFRFMIEYLRADDRGTLFQNILSPSQLISIGIITSCCIYWAIAAHSKKIQS